MKRFLVYNHLKKIVKFSCLKLQLLIHNLTHRTHTKSLGPRRPLIIKQFGTLDENIYIQIVAINQTTSAISYSERSEECIDFTMIITSRNNAPISNYGGGFRCKSEYPWCIIELFIDH
ncbi:Uncharacterized protein FWK35_00027155 [Aphis craccivora]|uniref:Uncharacterized protein n=1 Tax=Aphis craccivora TaxID=307492 RepID=A0A6G0W237_APHCR|nr:Uncharacterized protein FWK35_00027155 [Aphis craccivora]